VRSDLEGGRVLPTRLNRCFRAAGRAHPAAGAVVPGAAGRILRVKARVRAFGLGRVEVPRFGRVLQRGRNPGEQRPSLRGNPARSERTRRGRKASKQVKAAERSGSAVCGRGQPGSELRLVKRELSPSREPGNWAGDSADVGETRDRLQAVRSGTPLDNCKEVMWPREGCAIPGRGRL
jgi:hypothetical protein